MFHYVWPEAHMVQTGGKQSSMGTIGRWVSLVVNSENTDEMLLKLEVYLSPCLVLPSCPVRYLVCTHKVHLTKGRERTPQAWAPPADINAKSVSASAVVAGKLFHSGIERKTGLFHRGDDLQLARGRCSLLGLLDLEVLQALTVWWHWSCHIRPLPSGQSVIGLTQYCPSG